MNRTFLIYQFQIFLIARKKGYYIGCIKEGSRKNYATYEIKEYAFAIFEFQCKMFIAKHIVYRILKRNLKKIVNVFFRINNFTPDFSIDEGYDLSEYGFDAKVLYLPEHS